jgi:hypothetical protein
MMPDQQRSSIMSMSDPRRLTDAELAEVNGGVTASTLYFFRQRQRPHFRRERVRRGGGFRRCEGLQVTLTPAAKTR